MNNNLISLGSSMATGTKTNEVVQFVGMFPYSIKCAPRLNMVNIHWATDLILCCATVLAGVVITFSGFSLLAYPVGATPFFMAALPIAVIFALLPFCSAYIGAKISSVFTAVNNMATNINAFTALLAGQLGSTVFGFAFTAAKSNIASPDSCGVNFKRPFTFFTDKANTFAPSLSLAFRGAIKLIITMWVAVSGEFGTAIITGVSVDSHSVIIPQNRFHCKRGLQE